MKKITLDVNPYDKVHFGPSTVMTLHRFGIFDPDVARRVPTLSPFSAKLTAHLRFQGILSLPKSRFERTDDEARQGSGAQQRLRIARSSVCRAHPSQAKHAFAPRYNRWHISQGFGEGAPR